ncbi:hypothetical protein [Mycoplana dimorpha]|uniref:hypothetical protein n=1 Tax=Mycoplana dimorpha TaxID=28320 RepID=UPI0014767C5E|nr:hypothetical protein [Mycoplana dimorpha]
MLALESIGFARSRSTDLNDHRQGHRHPAEHHFAAGVLNETHLLKDADFARLVTVHGAACKIYRV